MIGLRQDFDLLSGQQPKGVGFNIDEQAVSLKPARCSKRYNLARRADRIDSKRFPLAVDPGEHLFLDFAGHFEEGFRLIIKGLLP
jgi:hypothetical protein